MSDEACGLYFLDPATYEYSKARGGGAQLHACRTFASTAVRGHVAG